MQILLLQKYNLLHFNDHLVSENIFILLMNQHFMTYNDFLHDEGILILLEKFYPDFNDCNHDKKSRFFMNEIVINHYLDEKSVKNL